MSQNFNYSFGIKDLRNANTWRAFLAEFMGNFLLNLFGCSACIQFENGVYIAFAFGFAIFLSSTIFGHLSGGHFNPAVTIAMLIVGRISLIKAIFYIIFQCLGSISGTQLLKLFEVMNVMEGLGHTVPATEMNVFGCIFIEFFLGFLLVLTVFSAVDTNKIKNIHYASFSIGMAVTVGHLGMIQYTGSSMNPARTLGTAVANNSWQMHYVYWLGPILGGIIGALIYIFVIEDAKKTE